MFQKIHTGWALIIIIFMVMLVTAFAVYVTKSLWALLPGLILVISTRYGSTTIKTRCPNCGHEFVASARDEDESDT